MEIIREPESNYLSHSHFKASLNLALLWPLACLLVSWYFWSPYSAQLKVTRELVFEHYQFWRLPLGLFTHSDLNHFLSNSLFLTILSYFIAKAYGPKILFGVGFLLGILTHALTLFFMKDHITLLGASGLLYAFWGFWFSLYFLIDRHISITRRLMKIVAISLLLLVPHSYEPHVSYLAHGIGFFLGLLVGVSFFHMKKKRFRSFESYRYILDPPYNPAFAELEDEFWKVD